MIKISNDGDSFISSYERRLWDFTYSTLLQHGCPIQFRVDGPNAPHKMNRIITFFVPKGRKDVADYIVKEWRSEVRPETEFDGQWFWGTSVQVMYFSGTNMYTEHAVISEFAENMVLYLVAKSQGKAVKISDFTEVPKITH